MAPTNALEQEPAVDLHDEGSEPRVVRVTVNLPRETVEVLRRLARRRGVTLTEALRLAIATENVLVDAIEQGKKVLLHDESRDKTQELILR